MFTEGIEGTHSAVLATATFRDKEAILDFSSILWTQRHSILRTPRLKACVVDVGGEQVDAGCALVPEVYEMR